MSCRIRILADLDGTLVDPQGSVFDCYAAAFAKKRHRKYPALKLPTGITAWDRLRRNLIAAEDEHDDDTVKDSVRAIAALASQRRRSWMPLIQPRQGAMEFLRQAYISSHFDVSIVSANMLLPGIDKLAAIGAEGFVDVEASAWGDEAWVRGDTALLSLERSGTDPRDAVVFGDTVEDIRAGRHAGTRVVVVCGGADPREDLEAAGPDAILDDLKDTDLLMDALLGHAPSRALVAA
ncbi:HAD family hydrolase [Actinoalloteichus sp. GBA129-24]|uniref:HAD family hydrolase n=1 Tax=Actinoalloteichus sp. GBA129-24 TaxID=1612551 RepID=UPI000950ABE2|nr:HAD hydrolase-like protein [Actinoalloteichus sp. GBA129-24]APU20968.1 putative phosphatase [Actinoalloteichus sp. GBA129-24]APU24217.1 putative phosphatase [Actinoalloteichus sp. GBA129-24]